MPGHEERNLRQEKRAQKRRTAKRKRARTRQALSEGRYESATEDEQVPPPERVAELHVGRNKPRPNAAPNS